MAGQFRIFRILGNSTSSIQGLTITGGATANPNDGGGVYNAGNLSLIGCNIHTNTSGRFGGGVYNHSSATLTVSASHIYLNSADGADGSGGGICNKGTLSVVSGSHIYSNNAKYGGGIFNYPSSTVSIQDASQIYGNSAGVDGGGIYNAGILTMSGGKLEANSAMGRGGGYFGEIANSSGILTNVSIKRNNGMMKGGGFYLLEGSLTLDTCTVSDNTALFGAGGAFKPPPASTYTAIACTITDDIKPDP